MFRVAVIFTRITDPTSRKNVTQGISATFHQAEKVIESQVIPRTTVSAGVIKCVKPFLLLLERVRKTINALHSSFIFIYTFSQSPFVCFTIDSISCPGSLFVLGVRSFVACNAAFNTRSYVFKANLAQCFVSPKIIMFSPAQHTQVKVRGIKRGNPIRNRRINIFPPSFNSRCFTFSTAAHGEELKTFVSPLIKLSLAFFVINFATFNTGFFAMKVSQALPSAFKLVFALAQFAQEKFGCVKINHQLTYDKLVNPRMLVTSLGFFVTTLYTSTALNYD